MKLKTLTLALVLVLALNAIDFFVTQRVMAQDSQSSGNKLEKPLLYFATSDLLLPY